MSPSIRYIVLSDVHLGAENSILTRLEEGMTMADVHVPSPALTSLVDCLRTLVAGNAGGERPTLVAAGDLIDLALSSAERAFPVYGQFMKALLSGDDPIVADESILLPGNHDHTLWESTRSRWLEDHMRLDLPRDEPGLKSSQRTGPMLLGQPPQLQSSLLTTFVREWTGRGNASVRVLYPDLALRSDDGRRVVLATHGHYIDGLSLIMSDLLRLVAPDTPTPSDSETMERENWAWIEFFFSSMTRAGRPGALIEVIYDTLQDPHAVEGLIEVIAANLTRSKGKASAKVERWVIDDVIGGVAQKFAAARDRSITDELLSDGSRRLLARYIGSLRQRLADETGTLPSDASLIIGHTHKPFTQWWPDETWPAGGLRVFNTGGWVVDHYASQPLTGGAVALVSEELDVALLRLYQQVDDPSAWTISVETVADTPSGEAFAAHIEGSIDAKASPWSTFSAAAADLVLARRREMESILQGRLKVIRD